jgi:predicted GIY-YIG superfamily endonuclease
MAYRAKANGRYYPHELGVKEDIVERRERGVTVFAQGHYYALQEAAKMLQLAPEHIMVGEPQETYRVYVIECTARTRRVTVHVGIAKDVARRVGEHKRGKVRATKGRAVVWLGNSERMLHGDALRLEAQLKKLRPVQKMEWALKQKERNTEWPT